MSSFQAQAGRVRDRGLSPADRLWALHACTARFAPYGFRATWHHLLLSARIPKKLDTDVESLTRALAELEAARRLWLSHLAGYAGRRREEKRRGRRRPGKPGETYSWGWQRLAYCPDLDLFPREGLVSVVGRLAAAHSAGAPDPGRCLVCETRRSPSQACPRCGVATAAYVPRYDAAAERWQAERWRQVWGRTWATAQGWERVVRKFDERRPIPHRAFPSGLEQGRVCRGVVTDVANFGVFVDLGGVTGFISVPELSWHRFDAPAAVVSVGQLITAAVLQVDEEREQVRLSRKALHPDPLPEFARELLGRELPGRVTLIAPIGVFVEVPGEVGGLIPIDDLTGPARFEPGDEVVVRVLDVNVKTRRVRFGLVR